MNSFWDYTREKQIRVKGLPRPRLDLIYYLLAAFDVLTVSMTLYLTYQIMGIYTRSVDVNHVWALRLANYSELSRLATAVNAPGNDVFDSHNVIVESEKMDTALGYFNERMAAIREELLTNLSDAEARPFLIDLDTIKVTMTEMTAEADLIYSYFEQNRPEMAGKRMATMDRKYAKVNTAFARLREDVSKEQENLFKEQTLAATSVQKFEYMIALFIALMVTGATLYGRKIARQMESDAQEREAIIEKLHGSEARIRGILDAAADGIVTFNNHQVIDTVNPSAERIFGYLPEELNGQNITILVHQLSSEKPQGFLTNNLLTAECEGIGLNREWVGRRKDGTTFPMELTVSEMRLGEQPLFIGIVRDVTERKRAEEALRRAHDELEVRVQERTAELANANELLQAEISERKRAEETLKIKTDQLTAVTKAMTVFLENGNWRESSALILRTALIQTCSEYGFAGVVMEGPVLRILAHEGIIWDQEINREFYENALLASREVGYLEFTNFENLFGRVITSGKAVISNDPGTDSRSGGLPLGHPPLCHFLGVPILRGNEVVGMIGVANRPGGYSGDEQNKIEILCQATGVLYDSYRRQEREAFLETQRREAESELHKSQSRFAGILDIAHEGIISIDENQRIIIFNKGAELIFGYSQEEAIGQALDFIIPERLQSIHRTHLENFTASPEVARQIGKRGEICGRRKNGDEFPAEASISKLQIGDEKILTVVLRDTTERKQAQEALAEQAIRDTLTSLYNRRYFNQRIEEEIARSNQKGNTLAILLCDLDHFKIVNDTRGHQTGDEILKSVAKSIQRSTRGIDLTFRWGGDEFVVVLSDTTREGILTAAERIRRAVLKIGEQTQFDLDLSIGIAVYPEHGRDLDELIRQADRALYIAKKGGDKIHIGVEEYSLDENTIKVVFQPIVDVQVHQPVGYEALGRDGKGKLSILDLFKKFQAIGQLNELKCLCFKLQMKKAQEVGLRKVFINVDFNVLRQLQPELLPPAIEVVLEISEGEALPHVEDHLEVAKKWQAHGYKFAIDDFGAGFISLPFIARLTPDYVKLDRSTMLQAVASVPFRRVLKDLLRGLKNCTKDGIIAEGVESAQELEVVKELGIYLVQGFLLGKPEELK